VSLKLSTVIEDLRRAYDEFGDVEVEMADTMDMEMYQPVTHVKFDQDRGRVQIISERLQQSPWRSVSSAR
jgi:hypothetical protein